VPNAQVQVRVPQDPDERSAWLVAGAHRLGQAVREVGPATEVWTWSEDPTAGFWLRRTTHDTLVHRADAELAVGREVAVDPDLAADGVADLLDMFAVLPRIDDYPELAGLAGHGQTLVLTRRAAPDGRVEVDGDERLFTHWLDHSRF
jgi:uncharacterized protein (TIGR03083 family)